MKTEVEPISPQEHHHASLTTSDSVPVLFSIGRYVAKQSEPSKPPTDAFYSLLDFAKLNV